VQAWRSPRSAPDWDRPFHRRACDGHNIFPSQISVARERAQAAEVSEVDYRKRSRRFDRVVSVGITEHVGIGHSPKNLAGPANCRLKTAKRSSTASAASHPGTTGPFIREYIFPSVYTPSLSDVVCRNRACCLRVADVEMLRRHYDYTLQNWLHRFAACRAQVVAIFCEWSCRMREFISATPASSDVPGHLKSAFGLQPGFSAVAAD
jgi:cyclopropane-fatty-acyl-phospholipid synthase